MTIRTYTTLLFTIATAIGMLLSIVVVEYDLPLILTPFIAYAVGVVLFDAHAAYVLRYLDEHGQ